MCASGCGLTATWSQSLFKRRQLKDDDTKAVLVGLWEGEQVFAGWEGKKDT